MYYKMVLKSEKFKHLLQLRISDIHKNAIEEEKLERQYNNDSEVVRQLIEERLSVREVRKKAIREAQKTVNDWHIKRHELVFCND